MNRQPPVSEWLLPTAFSWWGYEEYSAIDRVMNSNRFTMGAEVAAFEREFADCHGMAHGIMVNSGSSANLVAVSALRHIGHIKPGDKAIVPALAWATTYAPLVQNGLDLILVDCDASWNADPDALPAGAEDARLVVACSILGNPAALERWKTIAGVLDAVLIEDNCESVGAGLVSPMPTVNDSPGLVGRACGTYGLMNTFSFFYSHQISAIEGGMVLTNDDECAKLCRILRAHGWTRDVAAPASFDDEYNFVGFGYNVRPLEIHAAVACEQLRKLPAFRSVRQANAAFFRKITAYLPIEHQEPGGIQCPFGLAFTVKDRDARNRLALALRAAKIDCRLPTGGSFRKHAYGASWAAQRTPQADHIHDCGLFLGNGPLDLSEPIAKVVKVLQATL